MSRARTILAGSVGNAVEWFDWTIYASFAIFFSSQFFPEGNETTALLASFGIFAVGFFMRPVGGWLLGIFSDRYGRKAALPDHPDDGRRLADHRRHSHLRHHRPGRPLLLTAARLLQGLSLGGVCLGHDLPGGNGAVQPPWFLFQLRLLQRRRRHPGRVRRGLGADVHP